MNLPNKKKIITICLLLFILSIFTGYSDGGDRKTIVLAFQDNFFSTDAQIKFIEDLREAFSRIGYEMIMEFYPNKRCLTMADTGDVDGLPRSDESLNDYSYNLIKVDIPVSDVTFSIYTTNEEIQTSGLDNLRGLSYRVLYIEGVQSVRLKLESVLSPELISAVRGREAALNMLLAKRGDLLIDIQDDLDSMISQNKVAYMDIRKVGILGREDLYVYLHTKHSSLVPELEKTIGEMKDENFFEYSIQQ